MAATKLKEGLSIFFSAKTHKEGIPLSAIVAEKEFWQGVLSRYLQKHLNTLSIEDPFRVKNSGEVIEFLSAHNIQGGAFSAFYIDIEDLFYSIPQKEQLEAVRNGLKNLIR